MVVVMAWISEAEVKTDGCAVEFLGYQQLRHTYIRVDESRGATWLRAVSQSSFIS